MNLKIYFSALFFLLSSINVFAEDTNELAVVTLPPLEADIFQNFKAEPIEEGAVLTWSLDHDAYQRIETNGDKLIIGYNTKIRVKRLENGLSNGEWMYSKPFDPSLIKFQIDSLKGNEDYYFKLGFISAENLENIASNHEEVLWSEKTKTKTERGWGLIKFLILIGSLGFFIYGMKIMSEGIQQSAGARLRQMLGSITSNRFKGVLTGFGITSIVQSSSVTTVMTVSFVNAGLMTLRQSAGVMMGANIGTTITAWIVLILGFKVDISAYAYMILAFATPLLFISKGKAKSWANALFGFCILFIGLSALKNAVPHLDPSSGIVQFFLDYKSAWYGPVMFVILGALVTVIIQSSSAAMALTLAMASNGTIPFEVACAMVLGENIGTTITAEIASLIANVHAKRSARIHSMFNIVGCNLDVTFITSLY